MPGAPASPLGGDLLGYYSILGLEVRRAASYTTDDIKAAYRKAAMEMHPDKVGARKRRRGIVEANLGCKTGLC